MLVSQVCWQLFLGWALLLGQPVFGAPDPSKEPTLEEPEETVPVSPEPEEPQDPLPISQEVEEPVQGPQEAEKPKLEKLPPELLAMLTSEERYRLFGPFAGPPDEELEKQEREEERWLEIGRDNPHVRGINFLKQIAMQHHIRQRGYIYKLYEDANIKIKKAIGTMVYIKMFFVKTNCTREDGEFLIRRAYHDDSYSTENFPNWERKLCEVPPESEQEIEECTFTVFHDARKDDDGSITDQRCVPFLLHKTDH